MGRKLTVGLVAMALVLPGLSRPARAQDPLPAATFRLHCFDDSAEKTAVEAERIVALLEFAEAHDGEPVYLDAVIQADAGAGACSRDLSEFPDQPGPDEGRARITVDPCRVAPRRHEEGRHCWRPGMVHVKAIGPPMVWSNSIVLPAQADIPETLPYRIRGYGDWLNYQGPFIVHFYDGTGYAYATFHVPDAAVPGVWERARVNADIRKQARADATRQEH
ncbi:hypothetical protein [uncultured Brevundimonas sp.]|uniref:hypothetical protein n=1 Tax=uncultured Brevundimonas sp. TaxID=213418 RepID=UPI0030ECB8BC|tara:strand:+ start:19841 stop:20500 length:660 start_codon:yes stop_codon:yes gene_type:complete